MYKWLQTFRLFLLVYRVILYFNEINIADGGFQAGDRHGKARENAPTKQSHLLAIRELMKQPEPGNSRRTWLHLSLCQRKRSTDGGYVSPAWEKRLLGQG